MTSFEPAGAETSSTLAPHIEPSVGSVYSYAWSLLGRDFVPLLIVGLVAWLVGLLPSSLLNRAGGGASGLGSLYQILVGAPVLYGAAYAFLRAVRGQRPEVADLFVPFQRVYVSAVLANLIVTVIVVIGLILLVIPGIFLGVRLSLVPFIVVDEQLGPFQAIEASWKRTSGHCWSLLGCGVLGVLIIIVGLILLIVGSIPASMLVYLAFAAMYQALTERSPSTVTTPLGA